MKTQRPSKEQAIVRSTKFDNLLQAYNAYSKRDKEYDAEHKKIAASIKRLEEKDSRLWKSIAKREDFLTAIGNQVKEKLGGTSVEILGPFGMSSEMSVWVWKGKRDNDLKNLIFSISTVRDFTIRVAKSINPSTGVMNYVNVEPAPEMTIDWLIEVSKKERRLEQKINKK